MRACSNNLTPSGTASAALHAGASAQRHLTGRDSKDQALAGVKVDQTNSLPIAMELHLSVIAWLLFGSIMITHQTTHMNPVTVFLFRPRGPQMFPCLTYLERNVRVDCEFPETYEVPGPYCEFRQDSRIVGTTYPNQIIYVSTEDRRRSNVSLAYPNLCRLSWAPMADEKPYTYTCRVYQGNSWKENSMAVHHRLLPICSAISVMFKSAPWLLSLVMSLPVAVGLLSP